MRALEERVVSAAGHEAAIAETYAARLGSVAEIEQLWWRALPDGVLSIWTVIDQMDRSVEDSIFEAQGATLNANPAAMVDFRLYYRVGGPAPVVPPGATRVR